MSDTESSSKKKPNKKKEMTFKEKQKERQQKRNEQKRAKQKCRLCGRPGHIRKDCPGIDDNGRGQSKYKGKSSGKKKSANRGEWRNRASSVDVKTMEWPVLSTPFVDARVDLEASVYQVDESVFLSEEGAGKANDLVGAASVVAQQFLHGPQTVMAWVNCVYMYRPPLNSDHTKKSDHRDPSGEVILPKPFLVLGHSEPKEYHLFNETRRERLADLARSEQVVGIVTGLDYSVQRKGNPNSGNCDRDAQLLAAAEHLKLAVELHKPIMFTTSPELRYEQSAQVEADMMELLEEHVPKAHPIHVASYGGSAVTVFKLRKRFANLHVGLCGILTYRSAAHMKEIAFDTPINRILLESNSPRNTPNPIMVGELVRQVNDSEAGLLEDVASCVEKRTVELPLVPSVGLLPVVAIHVAAEKKVPVEHVLTQASQNALHFYGIEVQQLEGTKGSSTEDVQVELCSATNDQLTVEEDEQGQLSEAQSSAINTVLHVDHEE